MHLRNRGSLLPIFRCTHRRRGADSASTKRVPSAFPMERAAWREAEQIFESSTAIKNVRCHIPFSP